jgi:predicted DNA-binding protein YlxM (UPF0122 family)
MSLDRLGERERQIALLERYGSLLTPLQVQVLDLHLRQDWSLTEIAAHQGTSRAAAHDLIRRSLQLLGGYEARLGLLAEAASRRQAAASLQRELRAVRRRLERVEQAVGV